ncbi:tetratricopeptide repeat protein [Bacillus sp. T33-2]|uniref:tetratricopeptide repeat protein n=1 Tax=Bacillus sp. T33-2 TaxID=2054168 RepID=UPI000C77C6F5|nr:tetratricopeptide repeat protein [Bacillus sp. T33-2]PLR91928.1 hypothetical protein CVD19_21295 [Bacillus sp. T33-2]
MKTKKFYKAKELFCKVIATEDTNNYNLVLKLKAYNALASMFFAEKKITKSLELLAQALKLSKETPTITKEERDNIYFNRSILYLYIGANIKALQDINKVQNHIIIPIETQYVKLLIKLLEDELNDGINEELLSLRVKMQQTDHMEGLVRGWALTIYAILTSCPNSELVDSSKENLVCDLTRISECEKLREKSLALLQLAIFLDLKHKEDQSFIQTLINKTKQFQVSDPLLVAKNHYLEGKFIQTYLHDDSGSLAAFKLALETLDTDYDGLLKADILYEIIRLKEPDYLQMQALELYHNNLQNNFLFTHFHELALPAFRY